MILEAPSLCASEGASDFTTYDKLEALSLCASEGTWDSKKEPVSF